MLRVDRGCRRGSVGRFPVRVGLGRRTRRNRPSSVHCLSRWSHQGLCLRSERRLLQMGGRLTVVMGR